MGMVKFKDLSTNDKKRLFDLMFLCSDGFKSCIQTEEYEAWREIFKISFKEVQKLEIKFAKVFGA